MSFLKRKVSNSHFQALALGFTAMIGQVLLLREFITVFYGNETAYAIIMACWLFWVSAGSFVASAGLKFIHNVRQGIVLLLATAVIVLPATIVAVRSAHLLLGISTGEIVGVVTMLVPSFLLLMPLCFIFGSLYALICRQAETEDKENEAEVISHIYLTEAFGAMLGGLVVSFILLRFLPAMTIAVLLGVINIVLIFSMTAQSRVNRWCCGIAFLGIVVFTSVGGIEAVERLSRDRQWQGFEVLKVTDSIYGNIAAVKVGADYSLYENGVLSLTTRDIWAAEEKVHFAMLSHPQPKNVLLIGSGLDGSLREILKHSVDRVDYIELDPQVIAVAVAAFPGNFEFLKDGRVQTHFIDGRLFVKKAAQDYDVVLLNLPDPYNALINRYYTVEFFKELRQILNDEGLISLSVSASENYLNAETQDFLRSLHTTLKAVFPAVVSIPGDTNIFLAGVDKASVSSEASLFVRRLKERSLSTEYVQEYYLPFKLSPGRMQYLQSVLEKPGMLNTDMQPIAYVFDLLLWSTHFDTSFRKIFAKAQGLTLVHLLAIPALLLLGGLCMRRIRRTSIVTLSIFTTGLSEIVFQLLVILAFQTLYGYAYYKLGVIMAAFMMGLVLGSLSVKHILKKERTAQVKVYKFTQAAICVYPLLLPVVFWVFRDLFVYPPLMGLFAGVFAFLPIVAGFIGGVQYPLAIALVQSADDKREASAARPAGFLYAVDVLGAALGALVTGSILIPILGITQVAIFFALVNVAVLLLFVGQEI